MHHLLKFTPLMLLAGSVVVAGCGQLDSGPAMRLSYQFKAGQTYRLQARYESKTLITKAHGSKIFSEQEDTYYVNTAYRLQAELADTGIIQVNYFLDHFSLNDEKGKIRIEIGPESGQLAWYDDNTSLSSYLGTKAFEQYRALMKQPIATISINPRGEQLDRLSEQDKTSTINLALLELLSKNRVLGQYIVRAFKLPPVLMTIFPKEAVQPGDRWQVQGEQGFNQDAWQQGLTTKFHYLKREQDLAIINIQSQLTFKQEELNDLARLLKLDQLDKLSFQQGLFQVTAQSQFQTATMMPSQGKMAIEKKYSFMTNNEKWSYWEQENYWFSIESP